MPTITTSSDIKRKSMHRVQPANYLSALKIDVYQRTLFIGMLVILCAWSLYFINGVKIFLDSLVYPFFFVFSLVSFSFFNRFGERFLKYFEYSAFAITFIYFFVEFVQDAVNGLYGSGLNFSRFLIWIPILYAIAFFVFPSRKALYWSGVFLACVFIVGIGYSTQNWERPGIGEDGMTLIQIYLSGLIYISLFYTIAMLKDRYTETQVRSEFMTSLVNLDTLTGAHSRNRISELLSFYIADAETDKYALSIIMLDVDKLKQVNDTYGHNAGDYVLNRIVELLRPNIRETDFLGRWGGDEFLVVCPNTGADQVILLANRLAQAIENGVFVDVGNLSISVGVATYQPGDVAESLLKRADDEMYCQKKMKR